MDCSSTFLPCDRTEGVRVAKPGSYTYSTSQLSPEDPHSKPFQKSSVEGHTCVFLFTQVQGRSEVLNSLILWLQVVGRSGEVVGLRVFFLCDDKRGHATNYPSSFNLWPHRAHKHPLGHGSQMIKPNIPDRSST